VTRLLLLALAGTVLVPAFAWYLTPAMGLALLTAFCG
jgi:hypothetical protein